ncbi:MAG: hypothetical protein JSW00_12320 [Thermoplasmata archaeon]|nr:MAG: hypothetical protein JSW00_12320 [Thermoplasmata archaeon]
MFPDHCKEVSLKRVLFPLTKDKIEENLINKSAYKKTKFMVLNNGNDWAVVSIQKPEGKTLFSKIENIEIISLPDSTKYVEDPKIDVLSPTKMLEKAEEMGTKTLVIKGKFEHISFIHEEKMQPVRVLEVVPPEPPKLVELVKKVLYSGNVNKPVKIVPDILDLSEIAQKSGKKKIIFPCHSSGLKGDGDSLYLDQSPEIHEDSDELVLIGCDLSLKIFKTLYKKEPEFYNFCPKKKILEQSQNIPTITKCCEQKEGHERVENVAIVPWGATAKEVEEALLDILGDVDAPRPSPQ